VKTWRHPQNRKYITYSQRRQRRTNYTHRLCNMHKKCGKFGFLVFEICKWTDRQTDKHTHCNTLHPIWGVTKGVLDYRIRIQIHSFIFHLANRMALKSCGSFRYTSHVTMHVYIPNSHALLGHGKRYHRNTVFNFNVSVDRLLSCLHMSPKVLK